MKRIAAVSLLTLAPALVHADSVFLKRGGEIKGQVIERRADAVVIEVGPGRVTLPMASVDHIVFSWGSTEGNFLEVSLPGSLLILASGLGLMFVRSKLRRKSTSEVEAARSP